MSSGIESFISSAMKLRILSNNTPPWITNHKRSTYIIRSFLAAPLWIHRRHLLALRQRARDETFWTGIPHVLDHIIPICHPMVCGLTVPWNITVMPKHLNDRKSNHWNPYQLELAYE